jgi:SAM-dependent methyltransferase
VNPIWEQIKFIHKVAGLGSILRMRKKHAEGLRFIRGYVATECLWSLLNTGMLDELREAGSIDLKAFAEKNRLNSEALHAVCEYLDGLRVLRYHDGRCSLEPLGATLIGAPRGLFDLMYGYEPVFRDLEPLLRSAKTYGKDLTRRGDAVARGSGELGRQLPFLAVRELVYSRGYRRILDVGCGDLEFLFLVCERPGIVAFGIDNNSAALECVGERLRDTGRNAQVTVSFGDMFDVEDIARRHPDIEAITAIDVFHEYLGGGPDVVVDLLRKFKTHFPGSHLVVAEFFKLSQAWLRRIPTVLLEHHLCHSLTNQVILPIDQWIEVFEAGGYRVAEKKLVHAIGHGYFILE